MSIDRRALLALLLTLPATAARSRDRYSAADVEVRLSNIVASRIRTDMPGRIASQIRRRGGGGGRPVRVIVELRTIDPPSPTQPNLPRAVAAAYRVVDLATGRTVGSDRFTERTTRREDVAGTAGFLHYPRSAAQEERELADEVARHVLRYGL